jgi:cytochrome c peroxidase
MAAIPPIPVCSTPAPSSQPIKTQFPWITYSGWWTLAAAAAVKDIGEREIEWKGGRTDFVDNSKLPLRGCLPDSAKGVDHIRSISYRMGFNDREIIALSGAHNHGHCHSDRPKFEGKWVNNPTRFCNTHFWLPKVHDWKEKSLANRMK